ncbi:MAG: SH3 domain-containing protein [Clostridiales bacterium]|nr:SH3 domain-containing protein [Clostridiales bacterium]
MKFIDLTTKNIITKEKIKSFVAIGAILTVSVIFTWTISSILNNRTMADLERRRLEAEKLSEMAQAASSEISEEETAETSEETAETGLAPVIVSETSETTEPDASEVSGTSSEAEATTTTVSNGPVESEYYLTVYASQSINLRSGPGTEYDVVRTLDAGEQIDVIAVTDNGWYKTYNGNYVSSSYTQTEPIATTAATTAATTVQTTAAATTASTTAAQQSSSDSSGMTYYGSCTITFYGPQPLSDGTYSTTTATGTSCSEGRTIAADWSVFPAGTTIYIENDPLGGDGYYTVEDSGPGVSGAHIDIFTEGSYSTTSRDVYIVN